MVPCRRSEAVPDNGLAVKAHASERRVDGVVRHAAKEGSRGWQGDIVKLVEFLRCSLPFSVTKDLFRNVLLNLLSNVPYPYDIWSLCSL